MHRVSWAAWTVARSSCNSSGLAGASPALAAAAAQTVSCRTCSIHTQDQGYGYYHHGRPKHKRQRRSQATLDTEKAHSDGSRAGSQDSSADAAQGTAAVAQGSSSAWESFVALNREKQLTGETGRDAVLSVASPAKLEHQLKAHKKSKEQLKLAPAHFPGEEYLRHLEGGTCDLSKGAYHNGTLSAGLVRTWQQIVMSTWPRLLHLRCCRQIKLRLRLPLSTPREGHAAQQHVRFS